MQVIEHEYASYTRLTNRLQAANPINKETVLDLQIFSNSVLNPWSSLRAFLPNAVYMFTVSCYAFHPLIQRFVRLWRYVQIVSDVLTFLLSMICCQCVDAMPLSTSSSVDTKPSVQIFEAHAMKQRANLVDAGRSSGEPMKPQHLVIDFTPGREDTPEIQAKCQEFWQFAKSRPELDGMMVNPSPKPERHLIDLSNGPEHPEKVTEQNNLPAIHMMKKFTKKGIVKASLESGVVNKYYT